MELSKITKLKFIEVLKEKKVIFFTTEDVKKLFDINNENTVKQLLRRLKKSNIIKRLYKDKYLFLHTGEKFSPYALANFLVVPSYISLESALSFYGMITQFPYRVVSLTLKKTKEIKVDNKLFLFSHIDKNYFKDFEKRDDFLIARKEKAIFDYLYFIYKGLRPKNMVDELKRYFSGEIKGYLFTNAKGNFKNFLLKNVKL